MNNKAVVLSVYDGDSITCDVEYPIIKNRREYDIEKVRIYGIDTPEVRGSKYSEEHKMFGREVRDYVSELILNKNVELMLIDDNDKYGRLLAYVFIDGMDLGSHLIEIGYAQPYYGGTKLKWVI